MARKKLSARQVKARKQKQYTKYEYNLTIDALDYLNQMGADIKFNIVANPTKASLRKIRNIYNKAKKQLQKQNWVLPTKKEMAREVRNQPAQSYRKSRGKKGYEKAPASFQPSTDYISDLIEKISSQVGKDRTKTTQRQEEYNKKRLESAKQRLFDKLAYARTKAGDEALAEALAADDFVSHIDEMGDRYDYQIVESIDTEIIPALESAMESALDYFV